VGARSRALFLNGYVLAPHLFVERLAGAIADFERSILRPRSSRSAGSEICAALRGRTLAVRAAVVLAGGSGRCGPPMLLPLPRARSRARIEHGRTAMARKQADTVYKIVEVVGVSEKSWEEAGRAAVETAAGTLRDLRVAEVTQMDMKVENGKVAAFRTRVSLSFKYEA
jgi:flavin-binding protein dodecin